MPSADKLIYGGAYHQWVGGPFLHLNPSASQSSILYAFGAGAVRLLI